MYSTSNYVNNGSSFYQRRVPRFPASGGGFRFANGRSGPVMGGVGRVLTPGMSYTTIDNKYVVGANVGGLSASVRGALKRRANNARQANGLWSPCTGFCPQYRAPPWVRTAAPAPAQPPAPASTNVVELSRPTVVNVVSSNGNKYVFNGESSYDPSRKYSMSIGTYTFKDIPYSHPMAILNAAESGLTITYANKVTDADTQIDHYYGDITVTVTKPFSTLSVSCIHHGYMGGQNLLVYNSE